jgi:23S rRNA (cytosine1962-C5)-methyltransferase
VDRYGSALVVQVLSAGLVPFEDVIRETLVERVTPDVIWEQGDVAVRDREGLSRANRLWYGTPAWPVTFREHGLLFEVDPTRGQKTGHYLDQADNRRRAAKWAEGRRVADVFSYTGGFGLQAAKAGATRVVAVDQDEEALAAARRLAAANGVATRFETVAANAFDWLRAQDADRERYGLVVLDPPAFTKSRTAVAGALRGYREINLRAFKILEPGGILVTATCAYHVSAEQFLAVVGEAAHDAHRQARVLEVFGQPPDHPSHPALPESRYLTCAVVAVDD